MKILWDEIREANANKEQKGKAPLAKIDLQKEQVNIDIALRYQAIGPTTYHSSKASTFNKIPSFVGEYKSVNDVKKVPTMYKPSLAMLDTTNL